MQKNRGRKDDGETCKNSISSSSKRRCSNEVPLFLGSSSEVMDDFVDELYLSMKTLFFA